MSSAEKWWTKETVVLVTGANKGIGFEVARQLCEKGLTVILTARNEERGRAALQSLKAQGFQHNLEFFPFDVTSEESACRLVEWIKHTHGKLDILINNAALNGTKIDMDYLKAHQISLYEAMINDSITEAFTVDYETAKECIETNYFGVKRSIQTLLPLLPPQSRIVNVSSTYGALEKLKDAALREKLSRIEALTEEFIDDLVYRFLEDVKNGSHPNSNSIWPEKHATYRVSKIALNAYSRLLAQKLAPTDEKKIIYVNCVHPGFIKTDLIFNEAGASPVVGASNILRVALLTPPQLPTGQIFMEGELGDFITEWLPDLPKYIIKSELHFYFCCNTTIKYIN
ncbi:hypothetical protein SUGI_0522110 [Cryptomeria japonica]|uniref:(+)-neomenthol dehydrogenase n=1 Tax=Cryptomeria japonica TaxID=3369 RepID=UPI002408BA17|nr:(+)-neomenthol dehydrogenase [Cryptomeria japonica]GLJ26778.1 hypothetical protein SUGI_0522110 [Cryptomeria japonica]